MAKKLRKKLVVGRCKNTKEEAMSDYKVDGLPTQSLVQHR